MLHSGRVTVHTEFYDDETLIASNIVKVFYE